MNWNLQIGQFFWLLTHSFKQGTWKQWIQGKKYTLSPTLNSFKQIVQFSLILWAEILVIGISLSKRLSWYQIGSGIISVLWILQIPPSFFWIAFSVFGFK